MFRSDQFTMGEDWLIEEEAKLIRSRRLSNLYSVDRNRSKLIAENKVDFIISFAEEEILLKQYDMNLQQVCKASSPPMSDFVMSTASHYFKCFYVVQSVMDFPPMDIMYTCIYLGCKMLYLSMCIKKFKDIIPPNNRERAVEAIRNYKVLVMNIVNYREIVPTPHMFQVSIIDRIRKDGAFADPDRLKQGMRNFLNSCFLTSLPLLVGPVKLALAAVMHSAAQLGEDLQPFITEYIWNRCLDVDVLESVIQLLKTIISKVNGHVLPCAERVDEVESKLAKLTAEEATTVNEDRGSQSS